MVCSTRSDTVNFTFVAHGKTSIFVVCTVITYPRARWSNRLFLIHCNHCVIYILSLSVALSDWNFTMTMKYCRKTTCRFITYSQIFRWRYSNSYTGIYTKGDHTQNTVWIHSEKIVGILNGVWTKPIKSRNIRFWTIQHNFLFVCTVYIWRNGFIIYPPAPSQMYQERLRTIIIQSTPIGNTLGHRERHMIFVKIITIIFLCVKSNEYLSRITRTSISLSMRIEQFR